jgi:tellurite resistance-related uncharacterized protein
MNRESKPLPTDVRPYRRTAIFDETTVPAGLRRRHSTKPGVWGVIRVMHGRLRYRLLDTGTESILDPEHPGIVQPTQLHEVEPLGRVCFFVEFHCAAAAKQDRGEIESGGRHD